MASYSTNMGNASGSVCKVYGQHGTLDLTKWTTPTFSSDGAIKARDLPAKDTPVEGDSCPDHFLDWLLCLRSRKPNVATIKGGYEHSVAVIMAMKAFATGRRQVYNPAGREIRAG